MGGAYVLLALLTFLAAVLLGGLLLGYLWQRREQRSIEEKWRERERLLDRRPPTASRRDTPASRGFKTTYLVG